MSLAVIGAAGAPSGPKVCPVVIHRPISASSGRYSGPRAADSPTLPEATLPSSLSMPWSFLLWLGLWAKFKVANSGFANARLTKAVERHRVVADHVHLS